MKASAQLGNRLGPVERSRPRPAPPAPVPPAAPALPARPMGAPVLQPVPAQQARRAATAHSPVRSGRVARLAAAVTVTLAMVGGLSWLAQPGDPGIPQFTMVVRVGAGETVWDVAARVAPRSDRHAVVERICQLNGMVGTAVRPGQQLQVPDGR